MQNVSKQTDDKMMFDSRSPNRAARLPVGMTILGDVGAFVYSRKKFPFPQKAENKMT